MFANLFVSQVAIIAFGGLLLAVAVSDVRTLTIPNRYCAAIVLLYPIYAITAPSGVDWSDGAIVGGVALAVGFLLFSMRLAGAGDMKFFAAVSLWAGSDLVAELAIGTTLVGGVLGIAMLVHRRLTSPRPTPTKVALSSRVAASVNVLLGYLLLARAGGARVLMAGTPASSGTDGAGNSNSESTPGRRNPVGTLPYGAAISVGGFAVAAMLLMKG
jgi:prepilin peptidase CpaA